MCFGGIAIDDMLLGAEDCQCQMLVNYRDYLPIWSCEELNEEEDVQEVRENEKKHTTSTMYK